MTACPTIRAKRWDRQPNYLQNRGKRTARWGRGESFYGVYWEKYVYSHEFIQKITTYLSLRTTPHEACEPLLTRIKTCSARRGEPTNFRLSFIRLYLKALFRDYIFAVVLMKFLYINV